MKAEHLAQLEALLDNADAAIMKTTDSELFEALEFGFFAALELPRPKPGTLENKKESGYYEEVIRKYLEMFLKKRALRDATKQATWRDGVH